MSIATRRGLLRFLPAALIALALCAPLAAEESDTAEEAAASPLAGKTWEEITEDFLAASPGQPENVGVAYYNTVTGEYHALRGDRYYYAASVYKLPLNMYYAEQVYRGELDFEDKIYGSRYGDMQKASLLYSSNPESASLQGWLGAGYAEAIRPYLADEGEDYDELRFLRHSFTPRQLIHALRLLYTEPERFPRVLYYLSEAEPDNFFRKYETRFPIAHKYGWLSEADITIVNDVGIVWTDEPILLVYMSNNHSGNTETVGRFCELMCDYSQYRHALRLVLEARRTEAGKQRSARWESRMREQTAHIAELLAAASEAEQPPAPTDSSFRGTSLRCLLAALIAAGLAGGGLYLWKRKR